MPETPKIGLVAFVPAGNGLRNLFLLDYSGQPRVDGHIGVLQHDGSLALLEMSASCPLARDADGKLLVYR
jgi:hypothetical protein